MDPQLPSDDQLNCESLAYLETVLDDLARNPQAVPESWAQYFTSVNGAPVSRRTAIQGIALQGGPPPSTTMQDAGKIATQERLDSLVWAFRAWGHLAADVDPLGLRAVGESFWANLHPTAQLAELSLELHGLSENELDHAFSSPLRNEPTVQSLREILDELRSLYCGSIGYQFMHVQDLEIRDWFLEQIEGENRGPGWDHARRKRTLVQLLRADLFEQFIRKKFPGAKVFSIDGSESLIPMLDMILCQAADQEIRDVVLAMAHRGRLNVLTNLFNKPPKDLFRSFEDRFPQGPKGHGDVRYHLGDDVKWRSDNGRELQLSMCFNPSHLEYVNAVAMGRVRAMQDRSADRERHRSLTVLIHGDAAFAAEGIVFETLNLGRLPAYDTGGIVHVIINNQIGFTTTPAENRSSTYATDVARAVQLPVLHVNGEDMEAVARAARLAMDFRARFSRDIILDLVGFRRWGHNETDEPGFTQPRLYSAIENHDRLRNKYVESMLAAQEISQEEVDQIDNDCLEYLRTQYDEATREADAMEAPQTMPPRDIPRKGEYFGGPEPADNLQTGVDATLLSDLLVKLTQTAQDFHVHPKLRRSSEERRKMAAGEEQLDWAAGEALALASLAIEGHPVRLAGQDSQRGTFSHRHSVLHDVVDGRTYNIFSQLDPKNQAQVEIINTPLSEAAAMGFEYGYSLEVPHALVAWEAQFGDFVNVAQVIIDQFLASAEDKWDQLNGLVLMLPHGFEGQGPEHSSARLERFLQLAAEDNLQIVQPTTSAQIFHLLRRQVLRKWCKPLVIFTPKSLLRLRQARSPLSELAEGQFQRVIGEPGVSEASRVLLCSGKVYYDLLAYREKEQRDDVAIVRIEQFYPLHDSYLQEVIGDCVPGTPMVWVQDEPENMGAWRYWRARFGNDMWGRYPLQVACRVESASPATGSKFIHRQEQQALLQQAFGDRASAPALTLTTKEVAS